MVAIVNNFEWLMLKYFMDQAHDLLHTAAER
jgi:hypothetical protein